LAGQKPRNKQGPSDTAVEMYRIDQRYQTSRTAIRTAGVVGAVWFGGQALAPLAGEDTALTLAFSILGDLKFTASVALTGAACAWAVVERTLRHRKTQYLQDRVIKLEEQLDPNRSSSGLTRKGQTNPRDRSK
jgi:hypothetical protein